MNSSEIRRKFLEFFRKSGHVIIPSASLVTSDEKGVANATLFNTAGMQPLIPYLLGQPYIANGQEIKRLVNVQRCLRTVDIDDVGDKTHATFFEMLGNWSLGDYFKEDAIKWSYEFLTNPQDGPEDNRGLGLDPSRLYVTVFAGNENAPRDDEAANIWKGIFKANNVNDYAGNTMNGEVGRIFFMPASANWWEAGENGPCGPDTEMYYDIDDTKTGNSSFGGKGISKERFLEADAKKKVVEIWNDVFMQYEKKDGRIIGKLVKPSVDTGAGLERLAMVMQDVDNIYDTDLFKPVMENIKKLSTNWDIKSARIIADHIRAAVFLITDGVIPSNTDRGYVLRKLLRRAMRKQKEIGFNVSNLSEIILDFNKIYEDSPYFENLKRSDSRIRKVFAEEGGKFIQMLDGGDHEIIDLIKKVKSENRSISGKEAFILYSSYGFPIEETIKIAKSQKLDVNIKEFENEFKKHQALSRIGAERKFKGGLADANDEMVVRYHTATHLLHQALRDVLGDSVAQKGSNITPERLRFDFIHNAKMTDEEKIKVETIVNGKIRAALPVNKIVMSKEEAEKTGARHLFEEKYGDEISVYYIGESLERAYSKEFCGGPHMSNTKQLAGPEGKWLFKIVKEEAVAQGIRRIKAILN